MSIIYFVDTETTGLNPQLHTIIEVCMVKHVNRTEVDRIAFKIIPTAQDLQQAEPIALTVNKFDFDTWITEGISQKQAAQRIAEFCIGSKGSAMIAHNVKFDVSMLKALMKRTGTEHRMPYRCIDSVSVAYALFEPFGLRSFKMDSIRQWLGWSAHGAHTAEQDVADLIKLWDILSPIPVDDQCVMIKELIVDRRIRHGKK